MKLTRVPVVKSIKSVGKLAAWQQAFLLALIVFLIPGLIIPFVGTVDGVNAADLKLEEALIGIEANPAFASDLPTLSAFARSVQNGKAESLVGVYAPRQWAFQVSQQPAGNPAFVSSKSEVVTQFSLAAQFNTVGLLAHNHLAGSSFFELDEFNQVVLVYGDGSIRYYLINEIHRYRALSPNSPYSSFEDLQESGDVISVTELFNRIYAPGDQLVLQTCIEAEGILSWGRLFITGTPAEKPVKISYNYRPGKFRLD